jgi:hypothetical protein
MINLYYKAVTYSKRNYIVLVSILAIVIFMINYLSISTANVPIMDYWRFIYSIANDIQGDALGWNELWSTYGFAPGLLTLTLFINIRCFGLNTQFDIYGGVLLLFVISIFIYYRYKNFVNINYLTQLLFVPVILSVFNYNQWEILTLQFSLSFMIRILSFIIVFYLTDKLLMNNKNPQYLFYTSSAFFILTSSFIAGQYLPSLVITMFFVIFLHLILNRNKLEKKFKVLIIIGFLIVFIIAIIQIIRFNIFSLGGDIYFFHKLILSGDFFKAIFKMLNASVLHQAVADNLSSSLLLILGITIFAIYFFSVFVYFSKKMYLKSYFPITLIAYSLINIIIIIYARTSVYGLDYLSASRYVCETTYGLVGVLMIVSHFFSHTSEAKNTHNVYVIISVIIIMYISFFLILSGYKERKIAPYRKDYFNRAIVLMKDIDNYEDKDLGIFQANSPDMVRKGVDFMKQHNLGVFKSSENRRRKQINNKAVGSNIESVKWITSRYEDGWIGKSTEFLIKTGPLGRVVITGYYPRSIQGEEIVYIHLDNKVNEFVLESNYFVFELQASDNDVVNVRIRTNFAFTPNPPDVRILSFVLIDVKGI